MPLLAYCIIETAAVAPTPRTGLYGIPMEPIDNGGLRCFVSQNAEISTAAGGSIRDSALAFHEVLDEIFRQAAIIPFRFPTIFSCQTEVAAYLADHSIEYSAALVRLRTMVQMEIRIHANNSAPSERTITATDPKPSGTEYLQKIQALHARLEAAGNVFQKACANLIQGWKQRDSAEGIRCFALIDRTAMAEFRDAAAEVQIEAGFRSRISGPWPATQFLNDK